MKHLRIDTMDPAQIIKTVTRCAHYVAELYGKGCPASAFQAALAHELMKNLLQVDQHRVSGLVIHETVIVTVGETTPSIWSTDLCETLIRVNGIPYGLHINMMPNGILINEVKTENSRMEMVAV